ncbi:MAG: SulP family inorganic anion transporter [Porphyromonadaceae bacterium]|nr:SulP family inorganic anion transporter [Porphyromonadaceae bacterium]
MKNNVFRPKLLDVFSNYSWSKFSADLMSGIIVGIVALPLAIAFGIASGVAPEVGLITAILGGFIVSLLGGNSVQIGGPTGAFIVIVYGIIEQYGLDGLIIATLIAGVLLLLMGFLRLGTLIKFIPYPIVVGFTAGIAITIFSTQINDLFGLGIHNVPGNFIGKWQVYIQEFSKIDFVAMGFGLGSILIIMLTPFVSKKIPGSLISIILLTVLAYFLRQSGVEGIETIGDRFTISTNIPTPHLPKIDLATIQALFPSAFTIALLGAIESLLSASVADGVTGDRHRSNTELIAQGAANIVVPFFGGIPVTGAIARTMTNINNGGRTPVAGLIHAVVLLLILLFLGPLMDFIPMACLAGVLVIVSYNMSGWRSVLSICKGDKGGMLVMAITFFLTVLLDLTVAIEIGLLIAMLIFMKRVTETTNIVVSKEKLTLKREDDVVQSNESEDELVLPKGVEVYEINGPYFFGIANRFEEAMDIVGDKPKVRIIRMRKVPFMDSTAVHNLSSLIMTCRKDNVKIILSGVRQELRETLAKGGIEEMIGKENICSHIHLAVERAEEVVNNNNK